VCGKVHVAPKCDDVIPELVSRHTLNHVTASNETPRTPFAQLMVPTFTIYGREMRVPSHNALRRAHRKWVLDVARIADIMIMMCRCNSFGELMSSISVQTDVE
jgi:hypothetical protein